ncbi:hypothetical protein STRIP9103_02755 [Streptomyces ipomoeae 91-03]|uniref:Uncharacterized protein n=1 Tax=Streptomyces ipomoeae 91-03 TaxID=698759 RepID=L1KS31_9ACTN|nr:hypothetical protein STRIP9103_02755 [Streptomyces ipomoeae 91-03]
MLMCRRSPPVHNPIAYVNETAPLPHPAHPWRTSHPSRDTAAVDDSPTATEGYELP